MERRTILYESYSPLNGKITKKGEGLTIDTILKIGNYGNLLYFGSLKDFNKPEFFNNGRNL